jgi:hypothetical protein
MGRWGGGGQTWDGHLTVVGEADGTGGERGGGCGGGGRGQEEATTAGPEIPQPSMYEYLTSKSF